MSDETTPGEPTTAGVPARQITAIAKRAAELFHLNAWHWADGKERYTPASADIALSIRRALDRLEPGERIESGRLVVEWPTDEETGEPEEIRVFVHLGDLPLTTRKDLP